MTKVLLLLLLLLSPYLLLADGHIFVYHRFDDNRYPTTNISTKELKREFDYLKEHNYKVVPLIDIVNKIKANEKVPDNWVAFTIDDGFKTFYTNGLPIFRQYGYPFTLFIAVKYTEENYKDYVSWKQLKEIAKYGSIEFHSYGHGHFGQMSDEKIKADMDKGLSLMKKHLDYEPRLFVYPYGEYDSRVEKVLAPYNFQAVFNQNLGAINGECSDEYDIDRSAVVGSNSKDFKLYLHFKELCGVTFHKPLTYPKDKMVRTVEITLEDKSITDAEIFISNNGWNRVKVKNGKIIYRANKRVKLNRIKIGVKVKNRIKLMVLSK
ncbi:polysaccharide deacetylase family protein [Sulfurovum sp. bin170]|uniref:polysaccharide deacetylase family protein n=1 Tax=Sulfurovum sp. bin170 TaxID=2695268 RepID=UPI0013DF24F1|nr:polysaccharide deacetylase family protein [Sulfurovum sp. bin170]NEW60609.1 polysaccharide deacetylase family protein [Sulfurovum sp. bin170]